MLRKYLQCNEKSDCLDRIVATIDIITHKQVISIGWASSYPKELHQVVKLAMNVSAYCHRTLYFLHIWFLRQNFLCLKIKSE
jgi:hypothetical protein